MATKKKTAKAKTAKVKTKRGRDGKILSRKIAATSGATEVSIYAKLKEPAKEINARLERAKVSEDKANDLRLSAAQILADAKKTCDKAKVNFKKWCEKHIDQSYETSRKLLAVGQSKKPALALADMRAGEAKRAKKSRDKKKSGSVGRVVNRGNSAPVNGYLAVLDGGLALADKERVQLVGELAGKDGLAIVTRDEKTALTESKERFGRVVSVAGAQEIIGALAYLDKRKVLQWLTRVCEDEAQAGLEVPPSMDKRTAAQKKKQANRGKSATA